MIRLIQISLSEACTRYLQLYQAEIDIKPSYHEKIVEAKRIWRIRKENKPFREVKDKLSAMCSGARRCHYCEDSYADEIEHFFPKDIYPEKTFLWNNFLYACGPCNNPKKNKFAIFESESRILQDVTPINSDPAILRIIPPSGDPVLINPREENPLDFLFLDISDSFVFKEMEDDPSSEAWQRAHYTIRILKLNQRDDLVKARQCAYSNYKARLAEYISQRDNLASQSQIEKLIQGIKREFHPTVWAEMKRQHQNLSELKTLFSAAPEAFDW